MSDVVVVGAGLAGLAAAARLQALGHRVTICESADTVGGKLGQLTRDGFTFDTGPSLLTLPQLLVELFDALGGWPPDLRLRPVAPTHYHFADGSSWSPAQPGAAWDHFLERSQLTWQASAARFLARDRPGLRQLAGWAASRPRDLAAAAPASTLAGLARRQLADPRLRLVLERYATYAGSDPRRAPAALASIAWVEHAFGSWHVDGGLYRLAEAVRDRFLQLGGRLLLATAVHRVEQAGGRVAGVTLADGELLPADLVVQAAELAAGRRERSFSGFVLLLALTGTSAGLPPHSVWFPTDYYAEFDAVLGRPARPVAEPTIYLSAPADPRMAPAGDEGWFVLVNAPRHGRGSAEVDWDSAGLAAGYTDGLLDRLEHLGHPVRHRLRWLQAITPADLERRTGSPGGAIYGAAMHGPFGPFRPRNRAALRGLFRAGGWTHPGGGLPLVLLSARNVAGLIGRAT